MANYSVGDRETQAEPQAGKWNLWQFQRGACDVEDLVCVDTFDSRSAALAACGQSPRPGEFQIQFGLDGEAINV